MLCYVYFTTILKIKKRRGKTIRMIMAGLYKVPPTHQKGLCPFIPLLLLSTVIHACEPVKGITMIAYSKFIFQLFHAKPSK